MPLKRSMFFYYKQLHEEKEARMRGEIVQVERGRGLSTTRASFINAHLLRSAVRTPHRIYVVALGRGASAAHRRCCVQSIAV